MKIKAIIVLTITCLLFCTHSHGMKKKKEYKQAYCSCDLHIAVLRGDVGGIIRSSDITKLDRCGKNVLHLALLGYRGNRAKRLDLVRVILMKLDTLSLKKKEKLDFINAAFVNDNGCSCTPLQLAISRGYTDIVQELICAGADVTAIDGVGKTVLHLVMLLPNRMQRNRIFAILFDALDAKYKNRLQLLQYIDRLGIMGKHKKNGCYATALNLAVSRGYVDLVTKLLDTGADITIGNKYRPQDKADYITCLHLAASIKNKTVRSSMINLILETLNSPRYKDQKVSFLNARSFLKDNAESKNKFKCFTALSVLLTKSDFEMVSRLIDEGADVTICDKNILFDEKEEEISNLMKVVHIKDHTTRMNVYHKIIDVLNDEKRYSKQEKLAFLNRRSHILSVKMNLLDSTTVLNVAISKGDYNLVKKLIAEGADITNYSKSSDRSALHRVLYIKNRGVRNKIFRKIINELKDQKYKDKRADFLNARSPIYSMTSQKALVETPLHIAIKKGYLDIIKLLIEEGARYPVDELVHLSLKKRDFRIIRYFLLKGIIDWDHLLDKFVFPIKNLLCRLQASLNIKDSSGHNIFHRYIFGCDHALIAKVIRFNTGKNNIFEALLQKNDSYYDKNGFLCDRKDSPLDLLLNERFKVKNRAVMKALLETKNEKTNKTLLEQAKIDKRADIVEKIIEIKRKYDSIQDPGYTTQSYQSQYNQYYGPYCYEQNYYFQPYQNQNPYANTRFCNYNYQ